MARRTASVTGPLVDEHRALQVGVQALRRTAESVGQATLPELSAAVEAAYSFLVNELLPHAGAEDEVMYPVIDRALGAPGATLTMSRDHRGVEGLTRELGELRFSPDEASLTPKSVAALRRLLYGIYAIVQLHLAKEEEIYLPVLESALTPERAERLFQDMERSEERLRGACH